MDVTRAGGVKQERPRFWGLGLDYSIWDATNLNGPNYNNTLSQLFMPSWSIGKMFFRGTRFKTLALTGRFLLDRELVGYDEAGYNRYTDNGYAVRCSNITPSQNGGVVDPSQVGRCQYASPSRWDYSDLTLFLRNPRIYTIPKLDVHINPSVSIVLPASAESQYQTLNTSVSGMLGLARGFLGEKIHIGYTFWFTKFSHRYTTPGVGADSTPLQDQMVSAGYTAGDVAPTNANFFADPSHVGTIAGPGGRGYNPDYGFRSTFSFDYSPTPKLSLSLLYILIDTMSYPAPCAYTVNGQPYDLCTAGDRVAAGSGTNIVRAAHRGSQILWVTVGYDVLDWLNVNLAWVNWAPQRSTDGHEWRQPFISTDYNAFTMVNLGASVSLERAAAKLF